MKTKKKAGQPPLVLWHVLAYTMIFEYTQAPVNQLKAYRLLAEAASLLVIHREERNICNSRTIQVVRPRLEKVL